MGSAGRGGSNAAVIGTTPSADGATIPPAPRIVDGAANIWTVNNGVVSENNTTAGFSGGVILLLYHGGTVYQENASCLWWSWNGATWISVANPTPGALPCPAATATSPTPPASPAPAPVSSGTGVARWAVDMVVEEALVPFSSWANAVTTYGAVGDGAADDTAALQRALNDLGQPGRAQVLYLPAGTYKITATLNWTGSQPGGLALVGADPATTTIKWAGPPGGNMLIQNGGVGYRYNRITWDGSGKANIGVAHWWNGSGIYGGSFEHQDETFQNMNIGIMGGRLGAAYGNLDSEGQVRRVTFINDTFAGLDVGSFNALDWWVWDSHFINCGRGVSNEYSIDDSGVTNGAGAMYVYRSLFEGSTIADFAIGNTGWFSLHNNVSIGSAQFIHTDPIGENSAVLIVENNGFSGSGSAAPISYGDNGQLLLVDNQILSSGPVYALTNFVNDVDALSIGNQFTAAPPAASVGQRLLSVADSVVAAAGIATNKMTLPATPALAHHQVYEVPQGAGVAQIQALINQGLSGGADAQPIIHFAQGTWSLGGSLSIPADASIQLVGDGYGSTLNWTGGSGSMINVTAPARLTVRDMQWVSQGVTGAAALTITGADAPGGRIQMVGTASGPVSATHLAQTQMSFQANPAIWTLTLDDVVNAVAISNGGIGTVTMTNNSTFLMADTWYEGDMPTLFALASGTFTYLGGHPAPANHARVGNYAPMAELSGFSGTASFIGMQLDLQHVSSGIGVEVDNETPQTNVFALGNTSNTNAWFNRTGVGGEVGFNLNRQSSGQYPNQGDTSNAAIVGAWKQARSLKWDVAPYQVPAGSTDIRIYHMKMDQSGGVVINGR